MKNINLVLIIGFIFVGTNLLAQTITLNACHPLIENQNYTFNQKALDATGRNTFETNPVDENSPCGGIGNCEFHIAWNQISSRWEILADDGDGTFLNTYVLYYNTEASSPNPPSLILGTWVEEILVTQSLCGAITSLTGDVQDTTLGISNFQIGNQISIYPNPVKNKLHITHPNIHINNVVLYDVLGKLVLNTSNSTEIDVSNINAGLYFVKFEIENREVIKKIIIE
ncbi:T9SS type A sorting domain-containing protein [Bizionia myxarmorum]|nr:T9SS type A sorting domain-containing protein [Bizionia myxarmorum]